MDDRTQRGLDQLEIALNSFPPDFTIEATVRYGIHDDVPRGFISDDAMTSTESEAYLKVVDADGGMAKKTIFVLIPD